MPILSTKLVLYSVLVLFSALMFNFSSKTDLLLGEKQVLLSKTIEESFSVVSDLEKFSEWFPGIDGFMEVESGPRTKGKRYRETYNIPFYGNLHYVHTLTVYDPPRLLEFRDDSWLRLSYRISFSESTNVHSEPRTMMAMKVTSGVRTYWFQYLAAPLFKFYYDQRLRTGCFSLRMLVDNY